MTGVFFHDRNAKDGDDSVCFLFESDPQAGDRHWPLPPVGTVISFNEIHPPDPKEWCQEYIDRMAALKFTKWRVVEIEYDVRWNDHSASLGRWYGSITVWVERVVEKRQEPTGDF